MIVHSLVRHIPPLINFFLSTVTCLSYACSSAVSLIICSSFLADFPRKTVEIYCPTSVIFVYFCYHFESVKVKQFGSFFDSSTAAVGDLSQQLGCRVTILRDVSRG